MSVIDVVTISSPGSGSSAATAQWTAAEPDAQAWRVLRPEQRGEVGFQRLDELPLGAGERAGADRLGDERDLLVAERAAGGVLIGRQRRSAATGVMRDDHRAADSPWMVTGRRARSDGVPVATGSRGPVASAAVRRASSRASQPAGPSAAGGRGWCARSSSSTARASALRASPGTRRSSPPARSSRPSSSATPRKSAVLELADPATALRR